MKGHKGPSKTYTNACTVLCLLFEQIIDKAHHSGGTGVTDLPRQGFRINKLPNIYVRLQWLYGKPTIQELDQALLQLNKPMNRNQPVGVMLKGMEEIQKFLMAHPDGGTELSNMNLISYGSIKLSKCSGLYTKSI